MSSQNGVCRGTSPRASGPESPPRLLEIAGRPVRRRQGVDEPLTAAGEQRTQPTPVVVQPEFEAPVGEGRRRVGQSVHEPAYGLAGSEVRRVEVGNDEPVTADGRTPVQQIGLTGERVLDGRETGVYRGGCEPGLVERYGDVVGRFPLKPMGELHPVVFARRDAADDVGKRTGMGSDAVQLKGGTWRRPHTRPLTGDTV